MEKEIEEKWMKECDLAYEKTGPYTNSWLDFREGYLQGCQKRQEEIEKLQKRIFDQAMTISKLMPCATIDEVEEAK